jgi:prolipoprotein diacylglyceryltransferase
VARPVRFKPDARGAPEIEVEPDLFRGPRVRVAGERIRMARGAGPPTYPIPMRDGTTRPLRLTGGFMGLRAAFEGTDYVVEPPLQLWETFLVVLPLAILVLGIDAPTVAGTVVAAFAAAVSVAVARFVVRLERPPWVRAIMALAATAVGYVVAELVIASL